MLWSVLVVCVALAGSAAADTKAEPAADGPVTETPSGRFLGSWMETRGGRRFQAYRGVRYAEPPVGKLRFQPPVEILNYSSPVDARAEGPACPLPASPGYYVDEDCLTINVYTPDNNSSLALPVIFFIHPGGFYAMTGRSDLAGPHYLLQRDVILVTINYRLAALGWLSTGDAWAPGNNGMKDQVAALRWVQRYIRAFGGDPARVTAAGVSAGSISVVLHTLSPMSQGLIHGGIALSGSALGKVPTATHQRHLAVKQAQLLGCPDHSSEAIVSCLQTKPWKELGDSYPKFFEIGYDPVGLWGPVVEADCGQARFLAEDPLTTLQRGGMQRAPLILGRTTDEFAWFAHNVVNNASLVSRFNSEWDSLAPISFLLPRDNATAAALVARRLKKEYLNDKPLVTGDPASAANMGRLYVDSIEGFPVHRQATQLARYSPAPVYLYEFAYVGNHSHWEDPRTNKPIGAMHHDDMIYLFTLSYRFPVIAPGSPDDDMVEKMTSIWYNFARYGNPNYKSDTPALRTLSWHRFSASHGTFVRIGQYFSTYRYKGHEEFQLWEQLYPISPWPQQNLTCTTS